MKTIKTAAEMRECSRKAREKGKTIGFVPTMGYLHEGHLSLLRAARGECDAVVMSSFVNPAQFAPGEDFEKYPRDARGDARLAEKEGVDVMFVPEREEIYPPGYATFVDVKGRLAETLCGASRPGHFRGVATVVAKLLNIVYPDKAYFGQKDAQQAIVVRRMVRDLDMPVEIRVMPVVREDDGLAMSSRNTYLSADERRQAPALFRSLEKAVELASGGETSAERIRGEMKRILAKEKDIRVDYVEIVDGEDLEPVSEVKDNTLVAVAAFVGSTRLIDNVIIRL